ncbi:SURF1 family cytochrome oxidase biogenesis protein [Auritidibacter ignavus]|uniref:SURF1 family cytochrome oxidase biogenesis protein n=1 Tax=Auritidibacter ignavus TaxID=678932 RepID=UPI0024BACB02|nr:SURF1 family protein [Auritidibacter ignavus]WHS34861.1 SURF1 family protein [Auritidibacter ignavus]
MVSHTTDPKPKLDFRFLLSGPWIAGFIFCIVFAVVCYFLGDWQMDRRMHKLDEINKIVANYDQDPVPYAENSSMFTEFDEQDKWTPVSIEGEYLTDDTLLARNRPRAGSPGYEVLVPFRTVEGDTILINRGWLPTGAGADGPDAVPDPPGGTVQLIARVVDGEPTLQRQAPAGQVASIDLPAINNLVDDDIAEAAYGLMASETPDAEDTPQQLPPPERDEGPHLSYSMQWFTFGLMSFVVWGYMARLKAIQRREDQMSGETEEQGFLSAQRIERAKPVKRRRDGSKTDEEIEDEMMGY